MPRSDTPSQPRSPPSSTLSSDQGHRVALAANIKESVSHTLDVQPGSICHAVWGQGEDCHVYKDSGGMYVLSSDSCMVLARCVQYSRSCDIVCLSRVNSLFVLVPCNFECGTEGTSHGLAWPD